MNTTPPHISELICTRISHDLIGNIGAVANAVELLEEGDMDFLDDIRSILKVSSQVLAARLKFFRMAFGLENANLEDASLVRKTTADYLKTVGNQNSKIELEIGDYTTSYARLIMVSVMVLADLVIRDGKISVKEDGRKLYVNIYSLTKLSEQKKTVLTTLLSGAEAEYLAQYAPVFYLKELLKASELPVSISEGDDYGSIIG